jgi:hypothetical protein
MTLQYRVFDPQTLTFIGEPYDDFIEAYKAAQAHDQSAQVVAVVAEGAA